MIAPGLSLDFDRSFGSTITDRYRLGPLGRGWSHNWQLSLNVEPDGTVVIVNGSGIQRRFQPDSRTSGYFAQPGDRGVLTALGGGAFLLREHNGFATRYAAGGQLNFVEDTNGNRITASYTTGRLSTLTHSAGPSLTIGYNASGLVQSVTASDGRTVAYSYDAGQHLATVQGYDGRTSHYTYQAAPDFRCSTP